MALVLPPTLFGPLSIQLLSLASPGVLPSASAAFLSLINLSLINLRFSISGFPVSGFIESSHCSSKYLFGGSPIAFLSTLDNASVFLKGLFAKCFSCFFLKAIISLEGFSFFVALFLVLLVELTSLVTLSF